MATPKKSTTKKTPVKKAVTTKKSVAANKKTPAARKISAATKSSHSDYVSFRPSPPQTPFLTFKITRQTLYWLILSAIVLLLGAWVVRLETEVQSIYDSIDANNMMISELNAEKNQKAE